MEARRPNGCCTGNSFHATQYAINPSTRGLCTTARQQTDEEELRAYFPNPTEADWAKIKGGHTWDSLAGNYKYHNLVKRRLEPLKEYLGLSHAELEKIVLRLPAVLSFDHNNLVHEKLEPLQAFLDLNAAELKKIVLRHLQC